MVFSLTEVFDDLPSVDIVDVGASWIDGAPPYQRLIDAGKARLIGFEPAQEQFVALQQQAKANETYLPWALGDGRPATLHLCDWPGWTSLLELDRQLLDCFQGFGPECDPLRHEPIETRRLDDVAEVQSIDYLKLDVQGSELAILQGGPRKVSQALVVHLEVQFLPFYKEQPLFAELDQELRKAGFYFHRFAAPLVSRVFKPLLVNNNVYSGLSQVLWSDAVYVRRFTDFANLPADRLWKLGFILQDVYGSFDLALLALQQADRQAGTHRHEAYLQRLMKQ